MSMFKRFVEPGRLALITYGPCAVLLADFYEGMKEYEG